MLRKNRVLPDLGLKPDCTTGAAFNLLVLHSCFMSSLTLVVVGDPHAPQMKLLHELPREVNVTISDDMENLKKIVPNADVILNGGFHSPLFRQVFPLAARAQWVHNLSAGVESVLSHEMVASGVPLTNGRGVFSAILAEFVAGSILYFAKDFRRMIRNQEAGKWEPFDVAAVAGATLAVIGYGDIGRACAQQARALGMKILALRRRGGSGNDAGVEIYTRERIHEMLAKCDYLLLVTPDTPETRGMIGEAELHMLKPDAVIINIGRGPVINEAALIRALEEKRIKGAALDVFEREPLPDGHPFYRLQNVLLSPHCADHTPGWVDLAMGKFLENFRHFWRGEPLENIVDKRAGY